MLCIRYVPFCGLPHSLCSGVESTTRSRVAEATGSRVETTGTVVEPTTSSRIKASAANVETASGRCWIETALIKSAATVYTCTCSQAAGACSRTCAVTSGSCACWTPRCAVISTIECAIASVSLRRLSWAAKHTRSLLCECSDGIARCNRTALASLPSKTADSVASDGWKRAHELLRRRVAAQSLRYVRDAANQLRCSAHHSRCDSRRELRGQRD